MVRLKNEDGVRAGALDLMINSIVLDFVSLGLEHVRCFIDEATDL